MTHIHFIVPIEGIPFARAGSNGSRRFTPPKQKRYEGVIRLFCEGEMGGRPPLAGPVKVIVIFRYVPPKSWPQKRKNATKWKTSKPDGDNLYKIVADALKGLAWIDDAQVASHTVEKCYSDRPEVEILIVPLDESI